MLTDIKQLSQLLKDNNYKVYQTSAPANADYPYIVYDYVDSINFHASNDLRKEILEYQLSYITKGTVKELLLLKKLLKENKIYFEGFSSGMFDENDDTITQFNTFLRIVVNYE